MTNYSRSVLKSNGLRHSKNPPVKFGFSPINTPANIVKKLPSQRCFKPLYIAFFNFSHKRPTFAFAGESGYTLGFRRRIAHSGLHAETGASPPSATAWSCATSEITLYAVFVTLDSAVLLYTYISRFSVSPQHQQREKIRQSYRHKFYPPTAFQLLPQTAHVCFHERKRVHTRLRQQDRTQRLTRRNRGVLDGGAITTLGAFHTFRKPCVARCQNGKLCRFWVLVGGTPEGHREPAEQRCALMRVAVPRRRSPAGLRNSIDNVMTYCYFAPLFVANLSTVWYD